ncbi:MAG TPA: tetratricopeptide repeat protein [Planctomycetota bacterium]|nr:tetratricopeptide repeat protein [Planctomycetota bacterium]
MSAAATIRIRTAGRDGRLLIILVVLLPLLLIGGVIGFFQGRSWYRRHREDQDYALAKQRLAENKRSEAAFIISLRLGRIAGAAGAGDERVLRWYRLDIECAIVSGNIPRMAQLYERVPQLVLENEDASARLARLLLAAKEFEQFETVRAAWRGRETNAGWWLAVDVDEAVRRGRREDALRILKERVLPGRDDSQRLLSLAMLHGDQDPTAALAYLDQALAADPENPEVRAVRAMQLEGAGEFERARVELVAAQMADADNPIYADLLAEYHRRRGDLIRMVRTLATSQHAFWPESYRLKLGFWSRVAHPHGQPLLEADPGELKDLLGFIERLPPGAFWDERGFLAVRGADAYLRARQETWWLRILHAIKEDRGRDALDLIASSTFRDQCWQPDLLSALEQTLRLRLNNERSPPTFVPRVTPTAPRHPLLAHLDHLAEIREPDAALDALLTGPRAWAALCLVSGWNEAGLALMPDLAAQPADTPPWLNAAVCNALRWNRSFDAALDYARVQPQTPALAIQQAEMLIALKRHAEAIPLLEPLVADSESGMTAAWILTSLALEARDADRADVILARSPAFAASLRGRELTARTAVVRDRNEDADRLYGAIAEQSAEGALWMLHRARGRKDEEASLRWMKVLIALQPSVLEPPPSKPTAAAPQQAR